MVAIERPVRAATITETTVAGTLDAQREPQFNLCVRKLYLTNNPRGSAITVIKSRIGDGFAVTKVRALNGTPQSTPSFQLVPDDVCMKPSKRASKSLHEKLSHDNFEGLSRFRLRLIT